MNNLARVTNFPVNSLPKMIESFLLEKIDNYEEKTSINYRSHYNQFFLFLRNKTIEELTWNDFLSITTEECKAYRTFLLKEKNLSRNTINTKLASVISLYKNLYKDNKNVDLDVILNVERLKIIEDTDKTSYGSLTEEEMQSFLSFCSQEERQSLVKTLFFETLLITGNRRDSILNLRWEQICQKMSNSKELTWTIYVFDKGKSVTKPISNNFYEKLCQLKTLETNPKDRVFDISDKTVSKTLAKFCTWAGINQKERKIVIHSIKKTSTDMVFDITGDIKMAQLQGSHKSVETTIKRYLDKNRDYQDNPSYSMFENLELNLNVLESASKEELIEALKKLPKSVTRKVIKTLENH
jgi:integrase